MIFSLIKMLLHMSFSPLFRRQLLYKITAETKLIVIKGNKHKKTEHKQRTMY